MLNTSQGEDQKKKEFNNKKLKNIPKGGEGPCKVLPGLCNALEVVTQRGNSFLHIPFA